MQFKLNKDSQIITDPRDMILSKLREIAENRGAWCAAVHRVAKTCPLNNNKKEEMKAQEPYVHEQAKEQRRAGPSGRQRPNRYFIKPHLPRASRPKMEIWSGLILKYPIVDTEKTQRHLGEHC